MSKTLYTFIPVIAIFLFALCLSVPCAVGAKFPGAGKLVVNKPPAAGQNGVMTYLFKSKSTIQSLQVDFLLPKGCEPLKSTELTNKIGKVPPGKLVKVACEFSCREMGIFRVGVKATAYSSVLDGGTSQKWVFFEAGEERGFSPVIKPVNRWQKRVHSTPAEDEYVQVARNVYKSNTRVSTEKGAFQVDRYPVLPRTGDLESELSITAPPMLNRPVRLKYRLKVNENLRRRNAPSEVVFLLPHGAFRILNVVWPEGGDYQLMENGFSWKGSLPQSRELSLTADIMALTPGEGKIRALARVQGRGDQYTREEALMLRVNKRSAQIVESQLP